MPVEEHTEEIQVPKTKTTYTYICDVEGCEESTDWDPRDDEQAANNSTDHNLNYVAINPYVGELLKRDGYKMIPQKTLKEENGVYVCDEHIPKLGELIAETVDHD